MAGDDGGNGPRRPRVLVAEDEFLVGMELEELLNEHGWQVVGPVATVARALDSIAREPPEVALLDVNLRGERATPVAARLRAQNVPFVLVTGYGCGQLPEADFAGAARVMKPVDHGLLLNTLKRVWVASIGP